MVYVAFGFDVFSRMILGWRAASTMTTPLVLDALEMAIWAPRRERAADLTGLVDPSDAGSQGGFNRSSQHLDHGGVEWDDEGSRRRRHRSGRGGSGPRIGRCDRRCAHPGAPSHRVLCNGSSGA